MSEETGVEEAGQIRKGRTLYHVSIQFEQVLHLASAIAYGTTGMPPIEWLDDNHRRASINGKAVELEDIRRFVFERLEAAKIVLEKEVMFGHKFEELGFTSAKVVDALRNRKIQCSKICSKI